MSLLRRVRDITMATIYEKLEQADDPVRYLDRCLMELKREIHEAEKLAEQCWQHALRLKRQLTETEKLKEKRERQAEIALSAGEEHIARLALEEKLLAEEKWAQYSQWYEQSQRSYLEMEEKLRELKENYRELYEKRQLVSMRMESLLLQQRINERLSFRDAPVLETLEHRLSQMEWEAKNLYDLRKPGMRGLSRREPQLDAQIFEEMERLKEKLERERKMER